MSSPIENQMINPTRSTDDPSQLLIQALRDLLQVSNRAHNSFESYSDLDHSSHLGCTDLITGWIGYPRIETLLVIALRCPNLTVEALGLCRRFLAQETKDYAKYKAIYNVELQAREMRCMPPPDFDDTWVTDSQNYVNKTSNELRLEYQRSRENKIQESIRLTSLEMGELAFASGTFTTALSQFSKANEDCVNHAQRLDVYYRILRVTIAQFKHNDLSNITTRIDSINPNLRTADREAQLQAAIGLCKLHSRDYSQAAHKFMSISFTQNDKLKKIVSPHTIAKIIVLCSLATFERSDMKSLVLSNSNVKQFLELEPKFRDLLQSFYDANYSLLLNILNEQHEILVLDVYLGRHIAALEAKIKRRALRQFIIPYRSVSLNKVAEAFFTTEDSVKKDIIELISSENLEVRLDLETKVVWSMHEDPRIKVHQQINELTRTFRRQQRTALAHINFQQASK